MVTWLLILGLEVGVGGSNSRIDLSFRLAILMIDIFSIFKIKLFIERTTLSYYKPLAVRCKDRQISILF